MGGKVNLFTAVTSWEMERGKKKKKGFGKDLTHVRGKQTKGEHGAVEGAGLQSGTAGFQKEFH